MNKREIFIIILILAVAIASILFINNFTGNVIIQGADEFSQTNSPHWTHMPITYTLQNSCDKGKVARAMQNLADSTKKAVSFSHVISNADITISCSTLNNCYQNKTTKVWFWIITTEATCEHDAGEAQITKMRGNKILNAKINLADIKEKPDNCTETEIHELLHVFDYPHSESNESIMYPEATASCTEQIDPEIASDLIQKYKR